MSVQNLTTVFDAKTTFPIPNKLPDPRPKITNSVSHTSDVHFSNNALMLEPRPQGSQGSVRIGTLSSSVASQHSEFSLSLLDQGRYSDNWTSAVQPSVIQTNFFPPSECFRQTNIPPADNMASVPLQGGNLSGPSITSLSRQLLPFQEYFLHFLCRACSCCCLAGKWQRLVCYNLQPS